MPQNALLNAASPVSSMLFRSLSAFRNAEVLNFSSDKGGPKERDIEQNPTELDDFYFPINHTGCLIGILIMVFYYNSHITGSEMSSPIYPKLPGTLLFIAQSDQIQIDFQFLDLNLMETISKPIVIASRLAPKMFHYWQRKTNSHMFHGLLLIHALESLNQNM